MPRLVLASTSTYRRQLLTRLAVTFLAESPGVDEQAVKDTGGPPLTIVTELARQKASAVAARHPDAVVIGSDQAACIGNQLLDKPGTAANAIAQLRHLRGRAHQLLTAVAIEHPHGRIEFVDETTLHMRDLTDDEIERYVTAEAPLDCAGSYKIEGLGITLFERIDGGDQTAIVGLPLLRLGRELRRLGFVLP